MSSNSSLKQDPARTFAALGDTNRLRLVTTLCDGQPRSIARLTADSRLTRQAISKHLRVLEQAGLVQASRVGRENQFSYVPQPLEEVREYLNSVSSQWDNALDRLTLFVEDAHSRRG